MIYFNKNASGYNFSNIENPIATYSATSQLLGTINHNYKNNGSSNLQIDLTDCPNPWSNYAM